MFKWLRNLIYNGRNQHVPLNCIPKRPKVKTLPPLPNSKKYKE